MTNKTQIPSLLRLTQFTVDRAADAIFWMGPNGSFIYVNDAACRSLGYSRDELLRVSVFDIDPNFPAEIWPKHWKELREAGSLTFESFHRARNGRVFPVEISANYLKYKGREYNCAIVRKITERKRAEESLKNLAAKYHTVFELSTDAIMLLDKKGFFDCNEATLRLFGCPTRDDFISKHPAELSPPTQPGGKDSMSLANQRVATAIKNGSNRFEWMHRRLDGAEFPAEVLLTAMELDGKPVLQAVVRDITEHKQADDELRWRTAFFEALVSTSADGILVVDPKGRKLLQNRRTIELWKIPKEILENPDDSQQVQFVMSQTVDAKKFVDKVLYLYSHPEETSQDEVVLKDGTILDRYSAPVIDSDGHLYGRIWSFHDITEHKRVEQELMLAHTTINMSKSAFYWLSPEGQVEYVNDFACQSLGYSREELIGLYIWDFDPDFTREDWISAWAELKEKGTNGIESRHRRKDGSIFPIEVTGNYIVSNGVEHSFVFVQDISERQQANESIQHLAYFDALTGLPNRTLLHDRMEQLLAWATRDQKNFSVLFLDLDRFKYINDSMGHTVGDKLLQSVANRLKLCVREADTVSRIGGDEFIILLRDTDAVGAARVAHNILKSLEVTYDIDDLQIFTHASIGISVYPSNAADVEKLIKYADIAMYRAKEEGRNNFQFFAAEMNVRSDLLFSIEKDLRLALEQDEFSLHYQPQADLTTGKVCGAEALLRWKHSKKGFISPVEFIPVAEETGQIIPIGEWVLRTACKQLAEWRRQGMAIFPIAVNLSIRQLRQPELALIIGGIIKETGLQPCDLELEITESIMMSYVQSAMAFLQQMNKLGVQLSIDDFGTGFSSLSYLKKLPVNKLKIDQSFVRDIEMDESDDAIVRSIIGLGHQFQLKVIAEGLETKEQLGFLRVNGCDEIQGYYFSRPLPADEFMKFINGNPMLELPKRKRK